MGYHITLLTRHALFEMDCLNDITMVDHGGPSYS